MNGWKNILGWGAAVSLLAGAGGCETAVQTFGDIATAKKAEVSIDGAAPYVDLEYWLVDKESVDTPRAHRLRRHLGEHLKRERLPVSLSFVVNSGDELYLSCQAPASARVRILVEGKERRSYRLTSESTGLALDYRF